LTRSGAETARNGQALDVVTVQCQRCGDRYETTLPLAGIARVRRCRSCGRRSLEPVEHDAPSEPGAPADDPSEASRRERESGHA
jgi:ribosomal protein L37E